MGAYGAPDVAIAGMVEGSHNDFESAIAKEDIDFGSPVFGFVGSENKCYGPHKDKATVTLSADLVTSDRLVVVINGVTIDEVFATTHAATMTALIKGINEDDDLEAAGITAAAGATNQVIVISAPAGTDLVVAAVVTNGGAGTAAATVLHGTKGKFLGVAAFVQNGGKDFGAGTACWKNGMSVSILRDGRLYVPAESTVADKDPAYVSGLGGVGTLGKFTDVATNNYDIGGFFRSNVSSGLALLEVRGMK
jgi:hypothetical protein